MGFFDAIRYRNVAIPGQAVNTPVMYWDRAREPAEVTQARREAWNQACREHDWRRTQEKYQRNCERRAKFQNRVEAIRERFGIRQRQQTWDPRQQQQWGHSQQQHLAQRQHQAWGQSQQQALEHNRQQLLNQRQQQVRSHGQQQALEHNRQQLLNQRQQQVRSHGQQQAWSQRNQQAWGHGQQQAWGHGRQQAWGHSQQQPQAQVTRQTRHGPVIILS
ncbi:hypothetical protein DM01DRAFT_1342705 [Hesseltinella vesiculosa]|uniref:Uncharacterized protein n=1 Tax=Hesseltinella vesiculosa TaxID=101127 RepID=A0A1X2GUR0_9FUNG|nr:hypothetical protein DM01DRAFT_1342705 [Hesseltinella vesiculosa]